MGRGCLEGKQRDSQVCSIQKVQHGQVFAMWAEKCFKDMQEPKDVKTSQLRHPSKCVQVRKAQLLARRQTI